MLTFKPPTCLLHLSSILLNLVTLPSALVYTADTFKAQDSVFYILIYRHVAGYMEHLVLQLKTPKGFQVPKQQNLFHNRQSFAGTQANCVGTRHLHSLNCQEAISQYPSSHQDNTHFTAKMFLQCISHLRFFSLATSWKLRLFANCLGFTPQRVYSLIPKAPAEVNSHLFTLDE